MKRNEYVEKPNRKGYSVDTPELDAPAADAAAFEANTFDAEAFDIEAAVEKVVQALAATAVERDKQGGTALHERHLLRQSGLLTLAVPREYGGQGASWPVIYNTVRRLAEVDSSLAHLFAFQHLQVATVLLYGNEEQHRHFLSQTVTHQWFWGNALNPLDTRLKIINRVANRGVSEGEESGEGIVVNGVKGFCSGAMDADVLVISAILDSANSVDSADVADSAGGTPLTPPAPLVGVVAANHPGITVHDDWDAMGQRQTDSGTVTFNNVDIPSSALLTEPGPGGTPRATLRTCVAQLILVNLYLGIAQGAFETARTVTRTQTKPWLASKVESITQDPYILHRYGEMWLKLRAARALADEAAEKLQSAWDKGQALTPQERGQVAVAIAEAKLLSARAGLDISSQLFDVTGAKATAARFGLDRFWRNVRTHTLHDSLDYKLKEVGEWALNETVPTPMPYS